MLLDSSDVSTNTVETALWYMLMGTCGGENHVHILRTVEEQPRDANQLTEAPNLGYKAVRHHLDVFMDDDVVQRSGDDYGAVYLPLPWCRASWETVGTIVERMD